MNSIMNELQNPKSGNRNVSLLPDIGTRQFADNLCICKSTILLLARLMHVKEKTILPFYVSSRSQSWRCFYMAIPYAPAISCWQRLAVPC
jgi:hypothetical protein